jgi:thiamine-monophosphate kinase
VTGTIGDAAAGLQALRSGDTIEGADLLVPCVHRYLYPDPRVRAGLLLGRTRSASSCMDLSDGLADAVRQVAMASGVGMTLDAAAIPMSDGARRWHEQAGPDPLHAALTGGDDYELLFTVRPAHRGRFRGAMKQFGDVPATKIGVVTKQPEVLLRTGAALRELPAGYEHFR